ncbi:MAG: hypothetical protein ACKOKF_08255 [Bacteroidota bacterium]
MKNKKTYYLLVLDRSGSMQVCLHDTISGYNEQVQMIRDLQTRYPEQEFHVSLTIFNHLVEHPLIDGRGREIKELSTNSYIPDGGTAVLDAIGEGVINLKARHGREFDDDEATAVVVILTDGYENASKVFGLDIIRNMIRELEATGKWTFSFIGATRDALEVAQRMNIRAENAISFNVDAIKGTMNNISDSLNDYADKKSKGESLHEFLKKDGADQKNKK